MAAVHALVQSGQQRRLPRPRTDLLRRAASRVVVRPRKLLRGHRSAPCGRAQITVTRRPATPRASPCRCDHRSGLFREPGLGPRTLSLHDGRPASVSGVRETPRNIGVMHAQMDRSQIDGSAASELTEACGELARANASSTSLFDVVLMHEGGQSTQANGLSGLSCCGHMSTRSLSGGRRGQLLVPFWFSAVRRGCALPVVNSVRGV